MAKVYFDKQYDDGGLYWSNRDFGLKLRLAGNPKFLLKEIYFSELQKIGKDDIISRNEAMEIAQEKYQEILGYFDKIKHSPFVLYVSENK